MECSDFERDWESIKNVILKNESNKAMWLKLDEDFEDISYESSLKLDKSYTHACHGFLWCKNASKLWNYDLKASIMMQLRFDGHIGFPGGFIDPEDLTWEDGI